MAARLRIVVGFKPDGSPEPLYMGDSGQDAMQAFEKPTHKTHRRVEYFQFPQASKRRNLSAPAAVVEVPKSETDKEPSDDSRKPDAAKSKASKPVKEPKPAKKNA